LKLLPTAGSPVQRFRNRAKMSVTGSLEKPVLGILGVGNLDQGVDLSDCPIHHPRLNELFQALPHFIKKYTLYPYQIGDRSGELKGLIAFYSPESKQMYLRFVLRSKECVSRILKLIPELQNQFPDLVCISANLQPVPHAILEGKEEMVLTTVKAIDHVMDGIRLKLAPQAFVQTNVAVATELYRTAAEWISELRPKKMMELFCGQGAFSFFTARLAQGNQMQILGVEVNSEAVDTANRTAKELGLVNVDFKAADATCGLQDPLISQFHPDLLLVNPPRRGLKTGLAFVQEQLPMHFLYSSCSLDSLAQDLEPLKSEYEVQKSKIFDLFPHTEHFEILILLTRISKT
jgi:23S rRNA (uracil747-C5)-methyltransferase